MRRALAQDSRPVVDAEPADAGRRSRSDVWTFVAVVACSLLGLALRLAAFDESFFGDELFTYEVATQADVRDALAYVQSVHEITPPLYFLLAWAAQHLGDPFVWLRAVSLVAGVATIPLAYVLGRKTVGRSAGLVGAALLALSPMASFYSAEARGYALMTLWTVLSTLALLKALETRDRRWWGAVALLYAAATYTHYTSVFVLAVQAGWALKTHRDQWRPLVIALGASVVLFLPWLPGLLVDTNSPYQKIIGLLAPFGWATGSEHLTRLVAGGPFAPLALTPGMGPLILLALATGLGVAGLVGHAVRSRPIDLPSRTVLIFLLAAATPVGAALYSLVGDDLFVARNLMASIVPLYLALGALLTALPRTLAVLGVVLALGGMSWAAATTFDPAGQRPAYTQAAEYIEARAASGSVVIEVLWFSGPPSKALSVHLADGTQRVQVGSAEQIPAVLAEREPERVFLVRSGDQRLYALSGRDERAASDAASLADDLPGYRLVDTAAWPGYWPLEVSVWERDGLPSG